MQIKKMIKDGKEFELGGGSTGGSGEVASCDCKDLRAEVDAMKPVSEYLRKLLANDVLFPDASFTLRNLEDCPYFVKSELSHEEFKKGPDDKIYRFSDKFIGKSACVILNNSFADLEMKSDQTDAVVFKNVAAMQLPLRFNMVAIKKFENLSFYTIIGDRGTHMITVCTHKDLTETQLDGENYIYIFDTEEERDAAIERIKAYFVAIGKREV